MKKLFIRASYSGNIRISDKEIEHLPQKLGLVAAVQFIHLLPELLGQLEAHGKKAIICGQILGCEFSAAEKEKAKVDAFFYIGTGLFHPVGLAEQTKTDVYSYDPITKKASKVKKQDVQKIERLKKGALLKLLSADNIGILISTKPGQNQIEKAIALKKKLKRKNVYLFIADTIDLSMRENFPFIQSWVNSACPRMSEDMPGIIGIDDIRNS